MELIIVGLKFGTLQDHQCNIKWELEDNIRRLTKHDIKNMTTSSAKLLLA